MRYYFIAGEKSGDMHAANLILELKKRDPQAEFRGWGGESMEAAGCTLVKHYRKMAFMGFWEVFVNLRTIKRYLQECKDDIVDFRPDVVVLVDYAGFNMRISRFCKAAGIRNFYYISPKVWAWNTSRALKIKQSVDKMFVIMHFEKAFYQKYAFEVDYVGNPLLDAVRAFVPNPAFLQENRLQSGYIALLPGSRRQEVKSLLPVMALCARSLPQMRFVVAGVASLPKELYEPARQAGIPVLFDQTYDLLSHAGAAVVASGTATLETALFKVPQAVVYKTSPLTYHIIKLLIKIKHISLVNLIADKEVVKELIQGDCTAPKIATELQRIAGTDRAKILSDYKEMRALIETEGASARAAKLMVGYLGLE